MKLKEIITVILQDPVVGDLVVSKPIAQHEMIR